MFCHLHLLRIRQIRKSLHFTVIGLALALSAIMTANAAVASVIFELPPAYDVDDHSHPMRSYTVGGITVTITPYSSFDSGATLFPNWSMVTGFNSGVSHGENGTGVRSSTGESIDLNGRRSGKGLPMEGLRFNFTSATTGNPLSVMLNAINFSRINAAKDDFNLTLDPLSSPNNLYMDQTLTGNGWFTLAAVAIGSDFMIWANDSGDAFRIKGLDVTAVPIPAAVWLFGTGAIGLLGFARRRKTVTAPA